MVYQRSMMGKLSNNCEKNNFSKYESINKIHKKSIKRNILVDSANINYVCLYFLLNLQPESHKSWFNQSCNKFRFNNCEQMLCCSSLFFWHVLCMYFFLFLYLIYHAVTKLNSFLEILKRSWHILYELDQIFKNVINRMAHLICLFLLDLHSLPAYSY